MKQEKTYGPDLSKKKIKPKDIKRGDLLVSSFGTVRATADASLLYFDDFGGTYGAPTEIVEGAHPSITVGSSLLVQGSGRLDGILQARKIN